MLSKGALLLGSKPAVLFSRIKTNRPMDDYEIERKFQPSAFVETTPPTAVTTVKSRGICLPAVIADGLARHHAQEQLIYKKKLKKLKKFVKNLVLENASLCDVVSSAQEDIAIAMEDRQFLIKKVMQFQMSNEQNLQQNLKRNNEETDKQLIRKYWLEDKKAGWSILNNKTVLPKKKPLTGSLSHTKLKTVGILKDKSSARKGTKQIKKKCPPIPLDSSGRPIFPLNLGRLTIHSLGEIIADKKTFHTEKMIYPVGFCSSRMYASLKNPHKPTLYTCTIKDGAISPRFDIVCDEDETTFIGTTPAECHSQILKKINMILGIDLLPVSPDTNGAEDRGLRFFGLSHPSVQNMVQACLGARKCSKYKWIHFEVCKSEAEAEGATEPEREASICHETLLRNIRFASNHM